MSKQVLVFLACCCAFLTVGLQGAAAGSDVLTAAAGAGADPGITTSQSLAFTSRTVLDVRTAGDNTFITRKSCGIASLGNGGSYTFCHTVTVALHPDGNWTFGGQGHLDGSFPGCGDVATDYEINGHGPAMVNGALVGVFRGGSIDASTNTAGFHFGDDGELTPAPANSTFTYHC
jgi:hypothetical protein